MSKLYKTCTIGLGPFACCLRCWYNCLVRFPIESVKTVSGKPVSSREACTMESLSCSVKALIMQITVRIDCVRDNIFFCGLRLLFLASFYLLIIRHSTIKLNLKCIAKKSIRGHKSAWSFCGLESEIDPRSTCVQHHARNNFSRGPLGRVKFNWISHTLHQFPGLKGSDKLTRNTIWSFWLGIVVHNVANNSIWITFVRWTL